MSDASDIIKTAKDRYKLASEAWEHIYRAAREDLHFLSDDPSAQWDEKEWTRRTQVGRPAIQVDQLTQFTHQVINDIKMNTPTIMAIPADLDSDPETAEIIQGRIKAIEYKSNADSPYDTAVTFSVNSSIGFIRVDRQYVDDESFEQELLIKRVINPLAVFLDHNSIEIDGSDAKYAFVLEEISVEDFKKKYPDATPISFADELEETSESEKPITIAEYFFIEESEEDYGLLPDGTKEKVDNRKKYKNKRKIKKRVVRHMKLAGDDILEETTFPGKYIPIVPVYGEEAWIDGKRHLLSLIRKAKPVQRMYNLWKSLETELLMKQQQAPVQAAEGQMAGYEESWEKPDEAMVLYYKQKDVDGNQAPPPQRLQPPTIPTGIVNAARETVDDIKATLGMYNASIGARSNETSGKAIMARQQEGDVATYHFGDNLVKSIAQVGKIIVCALPEVEDSNRYVTIIDKEENFKMIGINGAMTKDQERPYDFTKGKYDVRVITGAPFTTQRQQAAELYNQTIQAMPDLMPVIGDLVFKYQDAPGSMAISNRLKKLVDPKLLDESELDKDAHNPQIEQLTIQLQQLAAEAQQQIQALQQELQSKQGDMIIKQEELKLREKELEFDALRSIKEMEIKEAELKAKMLPQPTQMEGEVNIDESIAFLQQQIERKLLDKQMQEQKLQQQYAMEQQQMMLEQQKMQEELQEKQQKQLQAQALLEGIVGIQQTLGALVQSVNQPIEIMRDEQGNLIGAK